MKNLLFLLTLCLFSCSSTNQENASESSVDQEELASDGINDNEHVETKFPEDWIGYYSGEMYIVTANQGLVDSIEVSLNIEPTDVPNQWTYYMEYDSERNGLIVKDYLFTRNDSMPDNQFYMDEQDGILIDEVLLGNTLYSMFTVAGSLISVVIENQGDYLDFDLVAYSESYKNISQNEVENEGDQVYVIESYPALNRQYVRLNKMDKPKD